MTDNVTVDNGSLADIGVATDKVTYSGDADKDVQLMRMVQVTGAEGSKSVVDLPGDATNGLDVDVTRVPTDPFGANADASSATGSISAKLRAIATALEILDDWDETDRAKVNLIVGQAGIAAGTGVDGVTVPRVTLATNVPLPAGTNGIGKLTANSGVDIGDVDVTSVPADPFGANADAASATGSISAKLRFISSTGIPVTSLPNVTLAAGTNTNEVVGDVAHDVASAGNPVLMGGYAKAAAPTDVDADADAVRAWFLRNGAQATVVTAAGALIGGDAANGLDVDITRFPTTTSAPLSTVGFADTITSSFTVGDSAAYAINDCISDSTSAPTAGGFTFTSAARASGGSGIITDLIVTTSNDAGTLLQGEIFIFDTAVTAVNTNSPFVISDSEALTLVAKIPFTLEDIGNNGFFHAQNLNIGFKTVGSANLRYLVRAKNAYTSAADVLNFRLKVLQSN